MSKNVVVLLAILVIGGTALRQTDFDVEKNPISATPVKLVQEDNLASKSQEGDSGYALSPQLVWPLVGTVLFLFLCIALGSYLSTLSRVLGTYSAMKSGEVRATSSSDITSSETSSTNRELQSRMERFEKRLQQHKMELQAREEEKTSSEEATTDNGSSGKDATPNEKSPFAKQDWFAGSGRGKRTDGSISSNDTHGRM